MAVDAGIVFASNGKELALLDEATGAKLDSWLAPPGQSLTGNLLVTDNLIFLHTSQSTYAIDRATLTSVWSTNVAGDLALGNDMLLISDDYGLYAYQLPEPGTMGLIMGAALLVFLPRKKRA
jgi:outer membrane protein assembly factor BamB